MTDAQTFGTFVALVKRTTRQFDRDHRGDQPSVGQWRAIEAAAFKLRAGLVDDAGLSSYLLVVLRTLEAWLPGRIDLERQLPGGRWQRRDRLTRATVRKAADGPFMVTLGGLVEQAGREAQRHGLSSALDRRST